MRGKGCNIPKELAIPPNSHTKSSQGATAAHNRHLGRCPMIWSLGTSVQARHLDFRPKKWVTGWIPSKRWVPQGATHRTTGPRPSTLHGYLPALWWLERLDFEDLKAPYLSTSMFEIVRTRWRGVIWIPTPEILPRLKSSFGTSCGGQLSELF